MGSFKLNLEVYWSTLLAGLLLVAIGLSIRSKLPKLGIFVSLLGAIPTLAGGIALVAEAKDAWNRNRDRTLVEQLGEDREIQGLRLPRGSTVETSGTPRLISRLTVTQPLEVSGIPFEGDLEFTSRDSPVVSVLKKGTLAAGHLVEGVPCKAHNEVEFNDAHWDSDGPVPKAVVGKLVRCTLSTAFELDGVRYAADSELKLDGGVQLGFLAVDQDVDGVPCKAQKQVEFKRIARDPGGPVPMAGVRKLIRCTLSTAFGFAGNRYAADYELKLNDAGKVEWGILAVDQDFDGHRCKQGTEVERSGDRATRFTPVRDETVDGLACKAGGEIVFDSSGGIISAVLAHDRQFDGIPCLGGEAVGFDFTNRSNLDSCVISRPVTILNVVWPAGSSLKGLSLKYPLEAILPPAPGRVTVGDVTAIGRCKVQLRKELPDLDVESLAANAAYAELLGRRFAAIHISEYDHDSNDGSGTGSGTLAEPATVDGTAFQAGEDVPLKGVHSPAYPSTRLHK